MAVAVHPRRLPRLLGAAAVLLLAAGSWSHAASPAHAADRTVEVEGAFDDVFTPRRVEVEVGDTVTWRWMANEPHTITFEESAPDAYDGDCLPSPASSCEGHTHAVRFDDAGAFDYEDRFTGATGRVVVSEPAPSPTPTPEPTSEPESPAPSPSVPPPPTPTDDPSPTGSDDPSPTGSDEPSGPESEPEPEPEGGDAPPPPEPADSPEPPSPASDPTTGTVAPQPVETGTASEDAAVGDPAVASADTSPSPVPDPTFEAFPDAEEPDPADDVAGEVAVGAPDHDGGLARTVWGVLGGVSLLGTLGVFGRRVLFAGPWDD